MEFVELSESEFKNIQDNMPTSSFYQTIEWAKIKKITGWEVCYVAVKENNTVLGATMMLSKKFIFNNKMFYAPRGFLIDYTNYKLLQFFTTELKKYIKSKKGILVKIDPLLEYQHHNSLGEIVNDNFSNKEVFDNMIKLGYRHNGFTVGYSKEAQFRWSYTLDINKSKEKLLSDMDQRCRRSIKKYEKYPLITVDVDKENIDDFKGIMESTARRHNHHDRSKEYYLCLKDNLKDRIKIIMIYLNKKEYLENCKEDKLYDKIKKDTRELIPISAGIFIFDKVRTNYVYGGTYSEYMPLMAQYKLQIDMIYLSMDKKIKLYDFCGISGDFKEGTPNYGVYEFKRGFGGQAVEYIGEFNLITNYPLSILYDFTYSLYRKMKVINIYIKKKIHKN